MTNRYAATQRQVEKSNRRVPAVDMEWRAEQAAERREIRARKEYLKKLRQEQEDRERYIIPEYQDLEEQLAL